jgi:hypothetical protein
MKRLLGLLAIVLLSACVAACGSSSNGSGSGATANKIKRDRDNDSDNNDDDNQVLYYGHAADTAERQQIVALITDYFAAAATEDGAKACTLLMPFVAESVVEDISRSPGLSGRTCAVVMTKLFKQHHSELSAKNATLKLTVLSFSVLPEVRTMIERRDSNGDWKVLTLLDGILE